MDFILFLFLTATLLIRPGELVEVLSIIPFFYLSLFVCSVASFVRLCDLLTPRSLIRDPVTFCVIGFTSMMFLSNVANMDLYAARMSVISFIPSLLYYLVLVVTLTTTARLQAYLTSLVVFVAILTIVSLLHFYQFIVVSSLPSIVRSLTADENSAVLVQLNATGIYGDPNDFCTILSVCIIICLCKLLNIQSGVSRIIWLVPLGLFFYAVVLTRSRGGFLGMLAGFMGLFVARFGWTRAILLGGITLPPLILAVGGRSTDFSAGESGGGDSTLDSRVGFWREGFILLFRSPIFGIGSGKFQDYVGFVAHNSFVHSTTEMGLLGGAFFMGAFYLPLSFLQRLRSHFATIQDDNLSRLRPYIIAIIVATMVSFLSISRAYTVPTFMISGIAVAYLRIVSMKYPMALPPVSVRLLIRLSSVYLVFLVITYIYVRYKL